MKKKVIALVLVCVLVFGIAVGGTLAFLMMKTDSITNVFTTSDVSLTLEETKSNFKMVPGQDIEKDPIITVGSDSEDCYVFVKIEKSANYDTYLANYVVADGWTELTSEKTATTAVYYRTATAEDSFSVLKDNKVTVLGTVTKDLMTAAEENKPTLKFTAYGIQQVGFADAAAAWAEAEKLD